MHLPPVMVSSLPTHPYEGLLLKVTPHIHCLTFSQGACSEMEIEYEISIVECGLTYLLPHNKKGLSDFRKRNHFVVSHNPMGQECG